MRDWVNEHFMREPDARVREHIKCGDGYTFSVQASESHYCDISYPSGKALSVEVWGDHPDHYVDYSPTGDGGDSNPKGWVPVTEVNKFIEERGGAIY